MSGGDGDGVSVDGGSSAGVEREVPAGVGAGIVSSAGRLKLSSVAAKCFVPDNKFGPFCSHYFPSQNALPINVVGQLIKCPYVAEVGVSHVTLLCELRPMLFKLNVTAVSLPIGHPITPLKIVFVHADHAVPSVWCL